MPDEAQFRFTSFRSLETPEELTLDSPPNLLQAALESAGVSFEIVVYCLERLEAATDEDTADLYPDGPDSGPERVFLYDFITTESELDHAANVAHKIYPND